MARKKISNVDIYNTIIKSAGLDDRLPEATHDTIRDIGSKIFNSSNYTNEQNTFIKALIDKIGLSLLRESNITNPYEEFVKYGLEFGSVIEEMFVQPAMAEDFDTSALGNNQTIDPYRITIPDVKATYISNPTKRKYRVTKMAELLKKAFYDEYGLDKLLTGIISSLKQGCNLDERNIFKDILNQAITNTQFPISVHPNMLVGNTFRVKDKTTALQFVTQVKNKIADMLLPSGEFNTQGVIKQLQASDIIIFLRKDIATTIQTELLSSSFNKEDLDFTPCGVEGKVRVMLIDDFGGVEAWKEDVSDKLKLKYDAFGKFAYYYEIDENTPYDMTKVKYFNNYMDVASKKPTKDIACMIVEKDLPIIAVENEEMTSTFNGEGLYINTVLHRWRTYGFSTFANYCVIKEPHKAQDV